MVPGRFWPGGANLSERVLMAADLLPIHRWRPGEGCRGKQGGAGLVPMGEGYGQRANKKKKPAASSRGRLEKDLLREAQQAGRTGSAVERLALSQRLGDLVDQRGAGQRVGSSRSMLHGLVATTQQVFKGQVAIIGDQGFEVEGALAVLRTLTTACACATDFF